MLTHNRCIGRADIKPHVHGVDYVKFGANLGMKLALQAMILGGRCKSGGELISKEDLAEWVAIKMCFLSGYKKPQSSKVV